VTSVEASAPGKLVLTGEYAVLEGAAAMSAAVNKRAVVVIRPRSVDYSELHIANSGERFRFTLSSRGVPDWLESPGNMGALLESVLRQINSHVDPADRDLPISVSLDTRDFYTADAQGKSVKAGIGSSAALAVALTAGLMKYWSCEPDFGVSARAHRDFQQGKGSGIDVVTSWHGGVVAQHAKAHDEQRITQLGWLPGLHILPVWTGVPASTPARLEKLAGFAAHSAAIYRELIARMSESSAAALACWQARDVVGFIQQIEVYAELLSELDAATRIGIWSDAHRQLQSLVADCGATYKPSGAGGGDYGLAFAAEAGQLTSLRAVLAERGVSAQAPDWATQGLQLAVN